MGRKRLAPVGDRPFTKKPATIDPFVQIEAENKQRSLNDFEGDVESQLNHFMYFWVEHILDESRQVAKHKGLNYISDAEIDAVVSSFRRFQSWSCFQSSFYLDERYVGNVQEKAEHRQALARKINNQDQSNVDPMDVRPKPQERFMRLVPDFVRVDSNPTVEQGRLYIRKQ